MAMAYARALAVLIVSCGVLAARPGVQGRLLALLALIFPMFYVNHVVEGLAFPPLVPVVAVNVVALAANLYEFFVAHDTMYVDTST